MMICEYSLHIALGADSNMGVALFTRCSSTSMGFRVYLAHHDD